MTKILLSVFIVLTFVFSASAQNSQPKTVTDFFYLLPNKYFTPYDSGEGTPTLRNYRKSIIKIEDVKNGYLRIEEPITEGWREVAIFKKKDGKYIVGILQIGCGPDCTTEEMDFLSYENGDWQDVTRQVLPKITDAQISAAYKRHKISKDEMGGLVYELPRVGTSIKVNGGGDYGDAAFKPIVFFEMNWDGAKFVLKDK
jgi:hypothetical protein